MDRQMQISQLQSQIETKTQELARIEGAIASQQTHAERLSQPLTIEGETPDDVVRNSLQIAKKTAENAVLLQAAREAIATLRNRKAATEKAIQDAKHQISELERADRLDAAKGAIQAIRSEFNAACEALEAAFWKLKKISKAHDVDFREGMRSPESLVVFGIGSVPNLVERPDGGFAVQSRDLDLFAEERKRMAQEKLEREHFRQARIKAEIHRHKVPQTEVV